jgi:ABC-type multidrug transport system fused ATPase/permease subunit
MINLKKIFFLFSPREKKILILISTIIFISILIEMFSLAVIVPVFNIIFTERSSWINFFINNDELLKSINFKIGLLIILLFIFFLKNFFLICVNFFTSRFYSNFQIAISDKLFSQYLDDSQSVLYEKDSENLLRKIVGDCEGLKFYVVSFQNLIVESIVLILIFFLLFFFNYKITLFCLLIFISVIFCYIKISKKRMNKWANNYQLSIGEVQNIVLEGIAGIKDIIIYNLKNTFFANFNEVNKKKCVTYSRLDFINTTQRFWMETVAITAVTIPLIAYIYLEQNISELIPIFALFIASLFRIIPSFNRIINHYNNIKFYQPSLDVIYEQFSNYNKFLNNPDANDIKFSFKKSLNFKDVVFYYKKNSAKILDRVNFNINKGECIIILGENGSGKSTLLNIISGLLKPNNGEVLVDNNINIYKNKTNWFKKISYVQQDIFLLKKTIKENIILGNFNNFDPIKFEVITKMLFLDQIFITLNNNLETVIGVKGVNLSGGQRQIISIARALYKNGEIFLFDEPSSALDYDNQKILLQVIDFLKRNKKTIIIITHDNFLFKKFADVIYRIENGSLIKQN